MNLEHPESLSVVTEVQEDGDDDEAVEDEADVTEDELMRRFEKMTFVVSTRKLEQSPHWVRVSEVFETENDEPFLTRANVDGFKDPKYKKYSQRLGQLRGIRKYIYSMGVLEGKLDYDEVTEKFVRGNLLGAKLRSSDLALAQITAKWRGSLVTFQKFQTQCAGSGFNLDLGLHLKNMVAFATGQKVDRDFVFLMGTDLIDPCTYLPKANEMTDFNMWTWNSRALPGIDPLPVRLGDKVRVR